MVKNIEFNVLCCHDSPMKNPLKNTCLSIITLCLSLTVYATDIYISTDENGNRVFSDTPSKNSSIHKVKKISTLPALEASQFITTSAVPEADSTTYQQVLIITPTPDSTLNRGELGNFIIAAQLSPGLQKQDEAVLLFDGQELSSGKQLSWQINSADRGTHRFQVIIRQKDGKLEKIASKVQRIHVKR